ncbi:transcription factor Sox-7-like [Branchiostoma floridae]|uniref:Sex-determining region Y protein n=2 Tax=Branchiostoma floridae TaxID=7739 RepID=A0A9J7MV37_BRAFL|nr:transcription factor Sox-7-like [Branchiostoma floridae]
MESSSVVPPKRREKSGGDYVKRPLNAFMVWSRVRRAKLREEMPDLRNTEISRRLGAEWREMSAEQKLPHIQRSRQLRIEHFDMYPNYRYRPKRKLKPGPVTGPRPVADILQASRSQAPPPPPPPSSLGLGYRPVTPVHTPPPGPPNACVSRVSGVPIPSALFCNFPYGYTRPSQQVFTSTACSSTRVCPTHNKPTMYPYSYSLHPRPYPHPYHRPLTLTLPSGSGTLHYIPTSLPEVDQDTVTSLPGSTRGRSTSLPVTTPTPQFLTSASYFATERPIITVPHYSLPPMTSLMHRSTNEASGSSPCVSAPSDPVLKCRPLQSLVSPDHSPSVQLLCTETDDDSDTETCSSPEEQGGSCHDNRRLQNLRSCTGLFWATPLAPGGGRAKEKVIVETVPAIEPVSIAGIEEPRGSQFRFEWN